MTTKKATPILERLRDQPRLLQNGHQTWGILHSLEPVGGGLICTMIGNCKNLFPEEYSEKLQGMIGQTVVIVRTENEYGCGRLDA